MSRTPASKASKEERASLARSEGQDGEGMRGSQGRRDPSQGGAEKIYDILSPLFGSFLSDPGIWGPIFGSGCPSVSKRPC